MQFFFYENVVPCAHDNHCFSAGLFCPNSEISSLASSQIGGVHEIQSFVMTFRNILISHIGQYSFTPPFSTCVQLIPFPHLDINHAIFLRNQCIYEGLATLGYEYIAQKGNFPTSCYLCAALGQKRSKNR